jgi:cyclopropane fatty-acyl-phospholipid synthase-like methyltransferase
MSWLILGLGIVFVLFVFVIAFGAPFLPTLKTRTADALDLLDLKPGQTLLELGSGDGRILAEAARRGVKSVGYELNPLLVLWSKLRTWRYRKLVTVKLGDYWRAEWPESDGIYTFLLQPYMARLDKKITQDYLKKQGRTRRNKLKVVSFAFVITGKKPKKERNGLFLYEY